MTSDRQHQAVNRNIKKIQTRPIPAARRRIPAPAGGIKHKRAAVTTVDEHFYRIEIRPKRDFTAFQTEDIGKHGHIQKVVGQRPSGSWATVEWLIGKRDAHIEEGELIPDSNGAMEVMNQLGPKLIHIKGDRFKVAASRKK